MERGLYKYAAVVLFAIIGIAGYNAINWQAFDTSAVAAWVQAVGSIAAILVAIWVGERSAVKQFEVARQVRDSELRERRASLKAVLDDVYVRFKRVEPSLNVNGTLSNSAFVLVTPYGLQSALDLLAQVPIFELDSGDLTRAVLNIRVSCKSIENFVVQYKLDPKERRSYPGDDVVNAFMTSSVADLESNFKIVVALTDGIMPELRMPEIY
ncbi:hypothetical protein [Burkholderia cepacia]|uniref:hypothetical protein n=1 Tax=Burkholderia cepacia TaxID=292 RepID=UPI003D67BFB5